jgi:hypothetical protein
MTRVRPPVTFLAAEATVKRERFVARFPPHRGEGLIAAAREIPASEEAGYKTNVRKKSKRFRGFL